MAPFFRHLFFVNPKKPKMLLLVEFFETFEFETTADVVRLLYPLVQQGSSTALLFRIGRRSKLFLRATTDTALLSSQKSGEIGGAGAYQNGR